MRIQLFTQKDCPKCPTAKATVEEIKSNHHVDYDEFDVESVDGMAEAAYYGIMSTPAIVLVNPDGEEVISWRGVIPEKEKILRVLTENQ